MGDLEPDGFGGIEGRSAADPDDPVTAVLLVAGQTVEHITFSGIRFHCREDHRAGRQARDPREDGGAREARVGDQQRTGYAALAQFLGPAADRAAAPPRARGPRGTRGARASPASVTNGGRDMPPLLNSSGRRPTAPAP